MAKNHKARKTANFAQRKAKANTPGKVLTIYIRAAHKRQGEKRKRDKKRTAPEGAVPSIKE